MRLRASFLILLACGVFALSRPAYAHTTGASWNVPVGDYTADLGYDPATFTAGQYTRFDFLLWRGPANTGEPADYSQIWVRIIRGERDTVLATGVWKQPVGPTTLLYEFAEPGTYKLEASYRDAEGHDVAVASFPITVNAAPGGGAPLRRTAGIGFAAGAALGALGAFLGLRARTR